MVTRRTLGGILGLIACTSASCMRTEASGPTLHLQGKLEALAEALDEAQLACEATRDALAEHRESIESPEPVVDSPDQRWTADEALPLIGVPECDEYVARYAQCIGDKMPEAARGTSYEALRISAEAWANAAVDPKRAKELRIACTVASEAVRPSCGWK